MVLRLFDAGLQQGSTLLVILVTLYHELKLTQQAPRPTKSQKPKSQKPTTKCMSAVHRDKRLVVERGRLTWTVRAATILHFCKGFLTVHSTLMGFFKSNLTIPNLTVPST